MASEKRFTRATRLLLTGVFQADNAEDAISTCLEIILEMLDGENGTVWVLNSRKDRLYPMCCIGPSDISNTSVRINSGMAGTVASTQESIIIPDNSNPDLRIISEENPCVTVKTAVCVPLISHNEIIGCIQVINKKDGSDFAALDMELCEHLAYLTAMSLEDKGFNIVTEDPKEVLISIKNLTKNYQNGDSTLKVLKGLNLDIYKNEFLVILGESGCGKSTLMNIIGGMDKLTGGNVYVEGKDISNLKDRELTMYRREYLGFVFQSYNLMPNLTALENVRFIAELVKDPMRPEDAIAKVKLTPKAGFYPGQMSGGQQQRVSIARAIVKNPKLILADEPTAALDYQTSIEVLSVIEEVVRTKGTTIVMITHNPQIARMADRVITMRDGKVANITRNWEPVSATDLVW